ncbi:MAG: signal recognition particle receptor subunit alpha [Pseudomonadota bacterium]
MLDNLTSRLSKVIKTLRGEARLTEANVADALREVRMALLEADVALPVVKDFIAAVKHKSLGEEVIASLTPGQALVGVVQRELAALMGGENAALNLAVIPPAVILMAGLQGSGKTTTSGKLAKFLAEQKKKPLLASCDVYRPAAIEQLRTIAKQLDIDFFESTPGQKPLDIALAALDHARKHYNAVLIVDTAGRIQTKSNLMEELKKIRRVISRSGLESQALLVLDANTGQNGLSQARYFMEAIHVDGIILAKLDSTSKGGVVLSIADELKIPILFIGTGQELDDLAPFSAEEFIEALFEQ